MCFETNLAGRCMKDPQSAMWWTCWHDSTTSTWSTWLQSLPQTTRLGQRCLPKEPELGGKDRPPIGVCGFFWVLQKKQCNSRSDSSLGSKHWVRIVILDLGSGFLDLVLGSSSYQPAVWQDLMFFIWVDCWLHRNSTCSYFDQANETTPAAQVSSRSSHTAPTGPIARNEDANESSSAGITKCDKNWILLTCCQKSWVYCYR